MNRQKGGVDVCLDVLDKGTSPSCSHGPTLLFERYTTGGKVQTFFACSAYRDRNDCNFYQRMDVEGRSSCNTKGTEDVDLPQSSVSSMHSRENEKLTALLKLKPKKRQICQKCRLLLLPDETKYHKQHDIISDLSDIDLLRPSRLLGQLSNNKGNAQFHFGQETLKFLMSCLVDMQFNKVICLGVPRLHDEIQLHGFVEGSEFHLTSLLLDIDHGLEQFYHRDRFCRYNMFNHYFFGGKGTDSTFLNFLKMDKNDKMILVMDPPFGGLVEVLAHTIKKINMEWKQAQEDVDETSELPIMWIFPYFLEHRITEYLPSFCMLDYKVNYENHPIFHNSKQGESKGCKHGSPVRIFTNISPDKVVLPTGEGYKLCKICNRYVSKENKHCSKCGACTSKDGRQYTHCDKCQRCVKPSKQHCDTCGKCELPQHNCGQTKSSGCHICGDLSHKRRDCPNRSSTQKKGIKRHKTHKGNKKKKIRLT